jgi:hypothetical protein
MNFYLFSRYVYKLFEIRSGGEWDFSEIVNGVNRVLNFWKVVWMYSIYCKMLVILLLNQVKI